MRALALPAALVALVVVCFSPVLTAGFVNWDDPYVLTENPYYRGFGAAELRWMFSTVHMGHYHPLTWLSFALDHYLWGMDARGYHLTNVLLHAASTVLVYALALRIFGLVGAAPTHHRAAAALAAALFAVHPLRVESVAWVTERRDVLSGVFAVATLLAWLRFQTRGGVPWYTLALGCFGLSLLAKATAMTLPAVLLLLDAWPLARIERRRVMPLLVEKAPFIVLAAGAGLMAYLAQGSAGAMLEAAHLTFPQRLMQAAYGLVFYVRKTLLPTGLAPAYLLDRTLDPTAAVYLASAAVVVAAVAISVAVRRRWPGAVAALAAYVVLVSPVLGLAQSGIQIAADRYTYLPSIPLALLAAGWLAGRRGRGRVALALAVVAALGAATFVQASVWRDSSTLWDHTLRIDPNNWMARTLRGVHSLETGDLAAARADFDAAIRLNPEHAAAYNNRGRVRLSTGDVSGALTDWDRAVALAPGLLAARLNRGAARLLQGDRDGAVTDLEAVVRTDPNSADGWFNLASAHAAVGRLDAAAEDVRRTLALTAPGSDLHHRAERKRAAIEAARNEAGPGR